MSQANAEGSKFCFSNGAERLEILEAGLEAIGQVLLKTEICERPLEVRGGSHSRTGQTGEGARLARLIRLTGHVNASPIPFQLGHSARPSTRIGEAGCLCNGLDLESRILRIFICPESGHWLGLKSRSRCWYPCSPAFASIQWMGALSVSSHHRAWPTESVPAGQSTYGVEYHSMQRPLPANQLNWLKTVWAGRG